MATTFGRLQMTTRLGWNVSGGGRDAAHGSLRHGEDRSDGSVPCNLAYLARSQVGSAMMLPFSAPPSTADRVDVESR